MPLSHQITIDSLDDLTARYFEDLSADDEICQPPKYPVSFLGFPC